MEYQNLGKTQLRVSRIGLGSLAFGGHYGTIEKNDVFRTIRLAIDRGITLFDTASWYGGGLAEEMLGDALIGCREDIIIADKVGVNVGNPEPASGTALANETVNHVETSLRRLRTDHIDICQAYIPDPNTSIAIVMETLEKLRCKGMIRTIGVYDADVAAMREGLKYCDLNSLQTSYNIINRTIEQDIAPFCRAARISLLACEPMCRGLLLGKFHRASAFDLDDLRSSDARFRGTQYNMNIENVNRLHALANHEGLTIVQLVLGWVLQNPSITSAVCGAKTPQQLREILTAVDRELTPDQIMAVDQIIGETKYQRPE